MTFGEMPPVYAKPKNSQATPAGAFPSYPNPPGMFTSNFIFYIHLSQLSLQINI